MHQGQFQEAISFLRPLAEKQSDDQLLYLMELGSAYQMAEQYEKSNEVFLQADRLVDTKDFHSVSNITLATLGSEEMIQYKGESYEKLLINTHLALNYMMLGKLDEALVECRRINEKISLIRQNGRQDYENVPFAEYLAGILWETDRKFDDAVISFENAYKMQATSPFIQEDLVRLAKKSRRDESYKKWKNEFSDVKENQDWYKKNKGEIVIVTLQGWGPRKEASATNRRFPVLRPSFSKTQLTRATLTPALSNQQPLQSESQLVYNIEQAAIKTLNADYGWMVARKIGTVVAKDVVADQIRQKNELLGMIAYLGMHLSDRADLRQWASLPRSIQMHRFWVDAGAYHLKLQGLDFNKEVTEEKSDEVILNVKPGGKTFYMWRPLK